MSTRRGLYEAAFAEATPARQRMFKPWERMTEEEKSRFGEPDKGPDEKVKKKVKAKKKTASKKASKKK